MKICIYFCGLFVLPVFVRSLSPIGVIIGQDDDLRQTTQGFWSDRNIVGNVNIKPEPEYLNWWDSSTLTKAVCSVLKRGVYGIATTTPIRYYPVLQSYANKFGIPLLTTNAPMLQTNRTPYELTLNPDTSPAVQNLLKYYQCGFIMFLYDEDDGPDRLQKILNSLEVRLSVRGIWRVSTVQEAYRYLVTLKDEDKQICILLSMDEELANDIFSSFPSKVRIKSTVRFIMANSVGILNDKHLYVKHHTQSLTKLSAINMSDSTLKDFKATWNEIVPSVNTNKRKNIPYSEILMAEMNEVLNRGLTNSLISLTSSNFTPQSIDCLNSDGLHLSDQQISVMSRFKKVNFHSNLTGNVQFSTAGERTDYKYNIYEIGHSTTKKIGIWSEKTLNLTKEMNMKELENKRPNEGSLIKPEFRRKLIVKTLIAQPYMMLKENHLTQTGNDRFEGYLKDIIDELAKLEDWDYELSLVKNGIYGFFNGTTWLGIIGEVMREEADIGLAPLTITSSREAVVDFSRPVSKIGLTILMKKPINVDITSFNIGFFGFLQIWTYEVWLLIALFYIILSGSMYAVSHFIGEPDRIRSLDTKLSDRLSLCSSFWFVFGSLVFRSTGIYPRSLSHRILTVVWWTFSLLLLTSYISSLTFSLMENRMEGEDSYSKNTYDVIENALNGGYPKVGTIKGGSTFQFFNQSKVGLYKDFGKYLREHPDVLTKSYAEGVKRIIDTNGGYAVITESPSAHYYSNIEPCLTMVTSGYLDHKAYGLAFKKGSILRETVDYALMNLIEEGVLRKLHEKWWHLQSRCDDPNLSILPSIYNNALTQKEVLGAFCVLAIGFVIAIAAGFIEYFVQTKRLSVDE